LCSKFDVQILQNLCNFFGSTYSIDNFINIALQDTNFFIKNK
jgi:hypothetical protein